MMLSICLAHMMNSLSHTKELTMEPHIAQKAPYKVDVEAGKSYY